RGVRGLHEVRLAIEDDEGWRFPDARLVQITDLGVTVRAAPDAVAVRVGSLASGRAASGASVRVLTPTNQELVSRVTDGDGVCVMRFARGAADRVPFLVEAATDDDTTFVDLEGYGVELADDALGGRPFARGFEAWVAPDRGLVRPGETLDATIVVRDVH